ncbi:MAG: hypothetical protein ACD_15C00137G0009 [uncultured bacterium]|nr:MAG: hypothetical protein ACD_15C00137G0009 [uncultured bacterium]
MGATTSKVVLFFDQKVMNYRKYIPDYRIDRFFMMLFLVVYTISKVLNNGGADSGQVFFDECASALFVAWWIMTEAVISEKVSAIEKIENKYKEYINKKF